MALLALALLACSAESGAGGYRDEDASTEPDPSKPSEPEAVVLEKVVDAPSGSFRAVLRLPWSDRTHALAIVIPGLGPSTAGWALTIGRRHGTSLAVFPEMLHYLGLGTLTFDLPGCGETDDGPAVEDANAYGAATRNLVLERAQAALGWASTQPRVASSGHFVLTHDFGGVDAIRLGDGIGAAAIVWLMPIVQSAADYLRDDLQYRDWLRRSAGADVDMDGAITPEEWGYYKGVTGNEAEVVFGDLDANGDGLYTRDDNELSGAPLFPLMLSLVDAEDDVAWGQLWGDDAVLYPSTRWAADALARPTLDDLLGEGTTPIFAFAKPSIDTPAEYYDTLETASAGGRLRLEVGEAGTPPGANPTWDGSRALPVPGVSARDVESCLLGLVTDPLDLDRVELHKAKHTPLCTW